MKFLGKLGIICHVAYYYKGNVYTTSCKKKSKPVITRGKSYVSKKFIKN